MNDHDQLREQMWDLVYDLVTPDQKAALEGRIKSDPKAARLYAEVSLEADLISQAAKVADTSVTLPHVEPRREKVTAGRAKEMAAPARGAGISRSLHWLAALAASALAVVLTVGTLWQVDNVEPQEQLVVIAAPSQTLVASLPATFEIETKDPSGKPTSATVMAQLADAAGASLYETEVQTDAEGRARLSVPGPAVAVGTKLKIVRELKQQIESLAPRSSERAESLAELQQREEVLVDALLKVEPEPIKAPALFDKDQYVPGEDARFRVVPQTIISRKSPDVSTLAFRLQTPDGRLLEPTEATAVDGSGIVTGKFQLPSDAPPGRYQFAVQGVPRVQPDDEAGILVAGDARPLPESLLAADAPAPGAAVKGSLQAGAGRGLDAPGPGGFGGGKEAEKREDSRDRARKLALGKGSQGEAFGAAGGPRGEAIPAPPGEPAPSAPVAGAAPSREALDELRVEKEGAQVDGSIAVNQLARRAGQREVDGKRATGTLHVDVPAEFAGKPVRVEAYFKQILLGKRLVEAEADKLRDKASEGASDAPQPRTAALALDPWVDGEKVDLVFQDESSPSAQPVKRQIEIPSLLDVNVADVKESYAPGETVRLFVEVTNRFDRSAVPNADLGMVVKPVGGEAEELMQELAKAVDDRVALSDLKSDKAGRLAASDEDRRTMSRRKMDDAPAPSQLESSTDKDAAKSTPLAAAGSPPAPAPIAGDVASTRDNHSLQPTGEPEIRSSLAEVDGSQPPDFESAGATTDFFAAVQPPVVISNEATVQRTLQEEEAARSARQAQMALWRARLGRLLLLLGVVMLLALGVAFAVQRPAKALVWIPSLAIAVASFAVGVVWLQGQPRHPGHEVAQSNVPAASGSGEFGRPMSPASVAPESEVALMMDSEHPSDKPVAGSEAGAAPSNEANGVEPRSGPLANGAAPNSTRGLRQRSAAARQDPQNLGEGLERVPARPEPASADQGEPAPRAKLPAMPSNSPAPPDAVAKKSLAPAATKTSALEEEGEKRAGGDASEANRKPGGGRNKLKSLSSEEQRLKSETKRMAESFKGGALPGPAVDDGRKKEADEVPGQQYARRAVTGVWQPLLETDENGRAVIEFTMPEAPGDYRLVLDVSGLGHVGQLQTKLRCAPLPAAPAPAAKP